MNEWVGLLLFFGAVAVSGLSGAIFRPGDWYKRLNKPSWTPPSWLFRPAWTILYVMISIAGWLVWRNEGFGLALAVWGVNLGFNAAWSWLMFERRRIDLAVIDAAGILATILIFIAAAWPDHPTAALLFVPYLLWVTFATALTFSLLRRNPQLVRTGVQF
jgi:tryptophan-rich sensory protein